MNFNKKIALVTGGNRGLGKNTALRLASYGVDSIITYNNHKEEADSVVSEIEAKDQRAVTKRFDRAWANATHKLTSSRSGQKFRRVLHHTSDRQISMARP